MTNWQIKFASEFWSQQMRSNPAVTDSEVARFVHELTDFLVKRNPPAICTVVKPQMSLALVLKAAELSEDIFPLSQIDMVFISDGSIQLFQDGAWTQHRDAAPNGNISDLTSS